MQTKTMTNPPLNQQKIVIYTRNTAWEQPIGRRLHRNVQVLKDKAERAGYEISKIYYESSSTSKEKRRPVLQQLLEDAEKGLFWVVLVWDVFTLTSDGKELKLIEKELARHDVELCSATESFDTFTEEGRKVFEYMCHLLQDEHLATKQDISMSAFARLVMPKGTCMKGDKLDAEPCSGSARPA